MFPRTGLIWQWKHLEDVMLFFVLGSSVMTMSAFRLVRAAHEAGAATAIVNVGVTRADDFVPLKINARLGEILPRVLDMGSISIPAV
ncbi:DHS-like NAD/FAD-binding domain superfamily [Sesbania bispinosa]|nr:DHS-like NAD/FAD-binding domain superfamily [Sesbania bispinosa]